MIKFVVLMITLALASELVDAASKQRRDLSFSTYPLQIETASAEEEVSAIQSLPAEIGLSQIRPLPSPDVEGIVVEAEQNPCAACFAYMADLVEQLADITVDKPETEAEPEAEEEIVEEEVVEEEVIEEEAVEEEAVEEDTVEEEAVEEEAVVVPEISLALPISYWRSG